MKKLLILLFVYVLVEGNNIIGDGLYVYHRGRHALEEIASRVDDYYPKVVEIDSLVGNSISYEPVDTISQSPSTQKSEQRKVYYR